MGTCLEFQGWKGSFNFPSTQHQIWANSLSFQVTVTCRGSHWRSSFLCGSRMRHPSEGWPSLVPSTPVQSSEQEVMTFRTSRTSLGSQLAPGLCYLSAIPISMLLGLWGFLLFCPSSRYFKRDFENNTLFCGFSCHQKGYSFYTFYIFWLETQQESSVVPHVWRPSAGRIPC